MSCNAKLSGMFGIPLVVIEMRDKWSIVQNTPIYISAYHYYLAKTMNKKPVNKKDMFKSFLDATKDDKKTTDNAECKPSLTQTRSIWTTSRSAVCAISRWPTPPSSVVTATRSAVRSIYASAARREERWRRYATTARTSTYTKATWSSKWRQKKLFLCKKRSYSRKMNMSAMSLTFAFKDKRRLTLKQKICWPSQRLN